MRQLEQEVARSGLLDLMKKCDRLDFLKETDSLASIGLTVAIQSVITGEDDNNAKGMAIALARANEAQRRDLETGASKDVTRLFEALHAARDRREKEFLEKTRELSERKIALSEARKLHQSEARE